MEKNQEDAEILSFFEQFDHLDRDIRKADIRWEFRNMTLRQVENEYVSLVESMLVILAKFQRVVNVVSTMSPERWARLQQEFVQHFSSFPLPEEESQNET